MNRPFCQHGWDFVFLDGAPAFLAVMQEMIEAADFVVIPVQATAPRIFYQLRMP